MKEYNIVITGNEYVGKTQIFNRMQKNNFNEDHYPTHGTNIKVVEHNFNL